MTPNPSQVHARREKYARLVTQTRHYIFTFFTVVFGLGLLTSSDYSAGDLSTKHNSLELDDGDVIRLFVKQESPFWPNVTKKDVESEFRYADLEKLIICPKLKAFNPNDTTCVDEEYEYEADGV